MILLTFMGFSVRGNTLQECKAMIFDKLANPAMIEVEVDEYTVKPDESLYDIAKKLYGCGEKWQEIVKLNRKHVKNASKLEPGIVLRLPKPVRVKI